MWPWEHLAVGYLGYSLLVHLFARRAPGDAAAVALAVGTQFPDLVDKPLAWGPGVLPAGYSLGHSVFVALPVSALAVAAARARAQTRLGAAFAVGYLAHLPGDVFYPLLDGGAPAYAAVLWPVVPAEAPARAAGFVETVRLLVGRYARVLASGDAGAYLLMEIALLGPVVAVWLLDGTPPLRGAWARVRAAWARVRTL